MLVPNCEARRQRSDPCLGKERVNYESGIEPNHHGGELHGERAQSVEERQEEEGGASQSVQERPTRLDDEDVRLRRWRPYRHDCRDAVRRVSKERRSEKMAERRREEREGRGPGERRTGCTRPTASADPRLS